MTETRSDAPIIDPPKPPGVGESTPQEKAQLLKNTEALRPRQTLYLKIRGYAPIEEDKSAGVIAAVEALEAALEAADVEASVDVSVTPPSEAEEKRVAEKAKARVAKRAAKLEAAAQAGDRR